MKKLRVCLTLLVLAGASGAHALDTVYLVRHADKVTEWPDEHNTFLPLSDDGERRADLLVERLGDLGIAAIYTSPTYRTVRTAMPLAQAKGLRVRAERATIDPAAMGRFLDDLRVTHAEDEAVLIVGHSNTIPDLLEQLGATADCLGTLGVRDHGEIEGFDGLWRVDLTRPGCDGMERQTVSLPPVPAPPPCNDDPAAAPDQNSEPLRVGLDLEQLAKGSQKYRLLYAREPFGQLVSEVRQEDDGWVVEQTTSIDQAAIRRQGIVRLDPETHLPRQARVTGPMGPSEADVDVSWDGERVSGHSDFPRSRGKPEGKVEVDRQLPAGTLELSSALALLPAMPIGRVSAFAFHAYEPEVDELRRIEVRVLAEQEIQVPAGTFEVYPVELRGGQPEWRAYVTVELPRRVVKLEIIDQPWVYELLP